MSRSMKPVILGMNDPYSTDPKHALSCHTVNSAGYRLWKMLNDATGATQAQYMESFDRRNLLPDQRWVESEAKRQVGGLSFAAGCTVLVLGDQVRRALDLPKLLIHPQRFESVVFRQVPHPSGRCLFYNDGTQRRLVAMLLGEMYQSAA